MTSDHPYTLCLARVLRRIPIGDWALMLLSNAVAGIIARDDTELETVARLVALRVRFEQMIARMEDRGAETIVTIATTGRGSPGDSLR